MFDRNQAVTGQSGGGLNMPRDIDYGYSTSVYSTPSNNFGGGGGAKGSFGNGVGSGNPSGGNAVPSNTVIVANVRLLYITKYFSVEFLLFAF